jgi:hypothetical protein
MGIVGVLVVVDCVEFYAESIFPVRTNVEGVFQGDGIEYCKCSRENQKKKQQPAGADLTLLLVESIEPVHSQSDEQNTEQHGRGGFAMSQILINGGRGNERPSSADAEDKQEPTDGWIHLLGTIERFHSYCVSSMSERCHFSEERLPPCLRKYPQLHNRLPETMWSYPMPRAALPTPPKRPQPTTGSSCSQAYGVKRRSALLPRHLGGRKNLRLPAHFMLRGRVRAWLVACSWLD